MIQTMSNPNGVPSNLVPFQKGQSGNPGGKPTGARNRVTGRFLKELAEHFEQHGKEAIERLCKEDPRAYINAIVRLCPAQFEQVDQFEGMSNDALRLLMAAAQQYVEKRRVKLAAESVQTAEFVPVPQNEVRPSNE